jgi:hypothetical protein
VRAKCKLWRCGVEFEQKRPWQEFCCEDHRREWWKTIDQHVARMQAALFTADEAALAIARGLSKIVIQLDALLEATRSARARQIEGGGMKPAAGQERK